MLQDRIILLISRKLSREIGPDEEQELSALLQMPEHNRQFQFLHKFWEQKENDAKPDVENALSKVMQSIEEGNEVQREITVQPKRKKRSAVLLSVTMLLVSASLACYLILQNAERPPSSKRMAGNESGTPVIEKQNAKGTRSLITLADGSKVWLNADSKLLYPPAFAGSTREVTLTGEAFFDVAKNKQKPFIIHLQHGTIKVLGTSFNIRAYEGGKVVETSVLTGKVAFVPFVVRGRKNSDTTFLTHNMKVIYSCTTGELTTTTTQSEEDKAWTDGKLIFRDAFMGEIAEELERNFGKEVIFNNEEILNYRLTGSFQNNTLEEILFYLSRTKPFTYRITETQIIISELNK